MINLKNIEFFIYENELWLRYIDGKMERLDEHNNSVINALIKDIELFYPEAYKALCEEYKRCKPNLEYYKYRIVNRFCRCNFAKIDNVADINEKGNYQFEYVGCPLRGECRWESVVCNPTYDTKLSASELRVMKPLYEGASRQDIADMLCLSIFTVNNHIANSLRRLNLISVAEFIKYASEHNLF